MGSRIDENSGALAWLMEDANYGLNNETTVEAIRELVAAHNELAAKVESLESRLRQNGIYGSGGGGPG